MLYGLALVLIATAITKAVVTMHPVVRARDAVEVSLQEQHSVIIRGERMKRDIANGKLDTFVLLTNIWEKRGGDMHVVLILPQLSVPPAHTPSERHHRPPPLVCPATRGPIPILLAPLRHVINCPVRWRRVRTARLGPTTRARVRRPPTCVCSVAWESTRPAQA